MSSALKTRLIGAAVLIALAVIVVPLFFSAKSPTTGNGKSISLAIPPTSDQQLTTRTLSVAPPGSRSTAADQTLSSDHLATVTIPSRLPHDVHPEDDQTVTPAQNNAAPESTAPAPAPVTAPVKAAPPPAAPAAASKPAAAPSVSSAPGRAANGSYSISMGAYADRGNAEKLMAGVRKLGFPVRVDEVTIGGKPAARVNAGPFDSRAAAEAARLKIKSAMPRAPTALVAGATDQKTDAAAKPAATHRAGGWAVQIGAYSSRTDALKLRDRLRAAGFDGFVDDVVSSGKKLWRVRVGPQTQRDEAVHVGMQVKQKLKLPVRVVSVP